MVAASGRETDLVVETYLKIEDTWSVDLSVDCIRTGQRQPVHLAIAAVDHTRQVPAQLGDIDTDQI